MREIKLTRGKVALVDDEDYERVNALRWHWHPASRDQLSKARIPSTGYAQRRHKSRGPSTPMHRFILGLTDIDGHNQQPEVLVDHINCDGLDNRRANLRTCTPAQNSHNSRPISGQFKGVFKRHNANTWRAAIRLSDRLVCLGTYPTPEMAAVAYNRAASKHFGEFAYLNTVPDIEPIPLPANVGWRGSHR